MTVAELGDRMSSQELSEWLAYNSIEPIGPQRADLAAGIIASTIANTNRTRGVAFKPEDFMAFSENKKTPERAFAELKRLLNGDK